jgi:putative membrane protein
MDPRVFFAAERTLLAWIRTGLTIIALGFVVARFGLFLAMFSPGTATLESHAWSAVLGVALVVVGALAMLGALYNHDSYLRTLPRQDIPQIALPWLTSALTLTVACFGLGLAAYLALA